MELRNLIEVHLDLPRLAKDLDELGHEGRAWAVRQWSRENMAALWEASKAFRAVTLDDFVPASVPPLVEVVHRGKDSRVAFSEFEDVFCKPSHGVADTAANESTAFGFTRHGVSTLVGPGYFVARASSEAGEVELDYGLLPSEKPASWPPLAPSTRGLRRFVHEGRLEILRGLSAHVSIGRAKRNHGWLDLWFALLREEPPA